MSELHATVHNGKRLEMRLKNLLISGSTVRTRPGTQGRPTKVGGLFYLVAGELFESH